jgi:epoxyqueuosine reductase QueG
MGSPQPKERPTEGPNEWLEEAFYSLLLEGGGDALEDFPARPIFGRPIMGVVEAGDDIFEVFRSVVSPRHIRPGDLLRRRSPNLTGQSPIKVVSWALPFSREIVISNRGREWPSELYSVARNNGAALIHQALGKIVRTLRDRGFTAVVPAQTDEYDAFRSAEFIFSSSWSERHVAYAAGLGRFGLHGCLITSLGTNVRFASLITSLPLEVTVKTRPDHRAPCLEDGGANCGLCLERCPVRAISSHGLDKSKCYERRQMIREKFLAPYSQKFSLRPSPIVKNGRREPGISLGCALCMSGVPCESRPFGEEKGSR